MDVLSERAGSGPGKILVFMVSYNAERHIEGVLGRIPPELLASDDVHFLCIDDASADRTATLAAQWTRGRGVRNLTVLRNRVNQGYGGNQKLGYRFAVDGGYDFVILLHGDGQYAPECLPRFIETWKATDADVVLGSRLIGVKGALQGGMPYYKLVGNVVLTRLQNALTGRNLSEYHTGFRGYSTRFLRSIPFEIDTNDFHFDTEILLQAFHVDARVVEFPIPTHYGDERCHVNGLKYAADVIFSTLQFKLHRHGMLCSLKYRNRSVTRYTDKTEDLYSSHAIALGLVREFEPATLLDIGCGPGYIARRVEEMGVRVTGVDRAEPEPGSMTTFHRCDLARDPFPVDAFAYDVVAMLDILEHLEDPEEFLLGLRNRSEAPVEPGRSARVVISTPNVAFIGIRAMLALGRFNYADRGILDIAHKRLFTRASLVTALTDCGYLVERVIPVGVPFQRVLGGWLGRFLGTVSAGLAWLWGGLFAFQFIVVCRPSPNLRQLLETSEKHEVASSDVGRIVGPGPAGPRA